MSSTADVDTPAPVPESDATDATTPADLNEDSAPPALFEHCQRTYEAMLKEAKPVHTLTLNEETGMDEVAASVMVYEGFLTQLVMGLNLSVPYYTSVRKQLINMGCIRQLKRGGGTSPSQWELIYEPTIEAFYRATPRRSKNPTKIEVLQGQVDNLSSRLSQVETTVEELVKVLAKSMGTSEVKE